MLDARSPFNFRAERIPRVSFYVPFRIGIETYMYDYAEPMAMIPGLASKLQCALADRDWEFAQELAAAIQAQAESIRGYAQAKMEQPVLLLGPER